MTKKSKSIRLLNKRQHCGCGEIQVMKFSFQMVFITFVVTLAHLVALAALSPAGGEFSRTVSMVEVETEEEPAPATVPLVNSIPLTEMPGQPEIEEEEAVAISRDEGVSPPKPTELVEVSENESEDLPQSETPKSGASGLHRIRQISPKPRS
jgi:hypothetical protein